jgi:ArsR family transcriptional regulator, lead/cadmium/zinc/bismuth-responsive transcriptional repressor
MLEAERVCDAIAAMGDPEAVAGWAATFSLLGDPTRLTVLLCVAGAGPISVTDLATATGTNDTTVSQCLRLLRASGTVVGHREGRVVRYELADERVAALLEPMVARAVRHHVSARH